MNYGPGSGPSSYTHLPGTYLPEKYLSLLFYNYKNEWIRIILGSLIRIRMKSQIRIRIRIKVKRRTRIRNRIKVNSRIYEGSKGSHGGEGRGLDANNSSSGRRFLHHFDEEQGPDPH